MTALAVQVIAHGGLAPSYVACGAGGDTLPCGDNVFIHVKNTDVASSTVTLNDPRSVAPTGAVAFDPDVAVVVPTGDKMIGPITAARFADVTTSRATVSYSSVANLTIAVLSV